MQTGGAEGRGTGQTVNPHRPGHWSTRRIFPEVPASIGKAHYDHGRHDSQPHVFLRIPNVALQSQIGGAEIGIDDHHNERLQDLEKTTERDDDRRRQNPRPEPRFPGDAHEYFLYGVHHDAEGEVHEAVEMVSLQVERILQPEAQRHFRVGIVRADRVPKENENEESRQR